MKKPGLLYQKVYEEIKKEIWSGKLVPGLKLDSEKQLSNKYGISPITVKAALKLLVADGLIKRIPGRGTFVAEAAAELTKSTPPSPNASANGMESRQIIGVVFEHVSAPYGLELMYHMDRAAADKGYKLCFRFSYTDQQRETEEIDFLLSLGVCGLLIMPSHGEHYNTKILKLVLEGFPVVLFDKSLDGIPVPAVYTDNEGCVGRLVDHLADNGYTKIGLVSSRYIGISSLAERKRGFYDRMAAHSLKTNEECIVELKLEAVDNTAKSIAGRNIETISRYLGQYPSLDSLVSLESGFSSDIYEACLRLGLKIPDDLAVCCLDEDYSSSRGYFFTHVKQDEASIAEKCMELIDRLVRKDSEAKIENYKIPGLFREGQTVKVQK